MTLPDEVWPCIFESMGMLPTLRVGLVSRACRCIAIADDDLWQQWFAQFWQVRQKAHLSRAWWRELLTHRIAEPAAMSSSCFKLSQSASLDKVVKWHERFVLSVIELWKGTLNVEELCFDVVHDTLESDTHSNKLCFFPRYWVLVSGALYNDLLGEEIKFKSDQSIDARSCLALLVQDIGTQWCWELLDGGASVAFSCLSAGVYKQFDFHVARSYDGGCILHGPSGLTFASREKTEEEHMYRSYNRLRIPKQLSLDIQKLYTNGATPFSFEPTLTSFERLVVHRLAENFGLHHQSRGIGLQRRIVIWRPEDVVEDVAHQEAAYHAAMAIELWG